jgi:hypothetical protein
VSKFFNTERKEKTQGDLKYNRTDAVAVFVDINELKFSSFVELKLRYKYLFR